MLDLEEFTLLEASLSGKLLMVMLLLLKMMLVLILLKMSYCFVIDDGVIELTAVIERSYYHYSGHFMLLF
jgi:hypothetical protein